MWPAFRLDPWVSVYISTVIRLRELVWILVGLGISIGLGFHRLSKE
jgi:hypothetical protein